MPEPEPQPDPWPPNPEPDPEPPPEPPQPAHPAWLAGRVRLLSRNGRRMALRRLGWQYDAEGNVLLDDGGLPRADFGRLMEMAEEGVRGLPEAFGAAGVEGDAEAIDAVVAACVEVETAFAELKVKLTALGVG